MAEMLYQGKVKQVWSTDDPDILEFRFTNQISVFDQIIPSLIPRKGESLNRTTAHWFKLIEEEGWQLARIKGSHHHYKHPIRKGLVTVPHPKKDIPIGTVKSILKQAGIKIS